MTHKPRYWLAWQALTQVSNLMFTNNMIYRFYAYNAYYYMFNDQTLVNQGVLAAFPAASQTLIYQDPNYGMDSVTKLANWFIASQEGPTSSAYLAIMAKFESLGMNEAKMQQIVGPASMIAMISNQISNTMLTDPTLDLRGVFDMVQLAQTQWAQGSILSSPRFLLMGVTAPTSIADPAFDPNFITEPEFSFYVAAHGGNATQYIEVNTAKEILLQDVESYQSLLNTDNMREFYSMYGVGDYSGIQLRFDLGSVAQIDFVYAYLESMIDDFLSQGTDYTNVALGTLV